MGLESATYISQLVPTNPLGTDGKAQGDDHIRLLKTVMQNTFPNGNGVFRFPTTKALAFADTPYSQLATEKNAYYSVDASGGPITLNLLPAATAGAGFIFAILKTENSVNAVTIDPSSTELINGAATISLASQGSSAIVWCDGSAWYALKTSIDIDSLAIETTVDPSADYLVFYDASAGKWRKGLVSKFGVPIGTGGDWWADTAPAGWIFLYGQELDRTTYASLFALWGTKYGVGNGSTTFNAPDHRDRTSIGKANMGGTDAARIASYTGGIADTTILGATGGEDAHLNTGPESGLQNHSHSLWTPTSSYTNGSPSESTTHPGNTWFSGTNGSTGASGAISATDKHNNIQPSIVCNKIAFAGV